MIFSLVPNTGHQILGINCQERNKDVRVLYFLVGKEIKEGRNVRKQRNNRRSKKFVYYLTVEMIITKWK